MVLRRSKFLLTIALLLGFLPLLGSEGTNFHWTFQQPTYLSEKDTPDLSTYNCDLSQGACKVNFDFTSSVPTDESSTHYDCLIDFGFGTTGQEDKCNPSTVEFPVGNWTVHLIVKKIADTSVVTEGSLIIAHSDGSLDPLRVTQSKTWQSSTYLVGKEDTTLSEYICDPVQSECRINLLVTPKLDGADSSQLTCEISTDFELAPTTDACNPNTSIVPKGDHTLTIKILDKNKNTVLQTSTVLIKNPVIDESIDPTKVVTDITWQQPTYLIGKEDTSKTEYTCDTSKTDCKVNLLVTPKLDGVESSKLTCHITTDFGIEESDCNPDTFTVPIGNHKLTIETKNIAGETMLTRVITLIGPTADGPSGGGTGHMNLSYAGIIVQSGLDEFFTCKTDTCQVNFSTEGTDGALCQWDFGGGFFETAGTDKKCNPGYVKFSQDARVTLTVTDPNSSANFITKILELHAQKNATETSVHELEAKIDLQTKILGNKTSRDDGVICTLARSKKCSLNFTAESSTGAKTWYWDFGDGSTSEKENPASHSFSAGSYMVRLVVSDGTLTSTTTYMVEVVSESLEQKTCLECKSMMGKIQISAVLPNPPHADTVEWIEIQNISQETLSLDACEISDDTESFGLSGSLTGGKALRLRQAMTGLNMGNTHELLTLNCGGVLIDTFAWEFSIPTNYILRRDVLYGIPVQSLITNVVDGDTVDAMIDGKKTRLRLLGIDTPETVHPRKPVEKFGKEASDFTRRTLEGKTVWLTFDTDPVDLYGRRLAYVWQCDGVFSETSCILFNAQVVSGGYGRMERRFSFRLYEDFDALEKQAKNEKRGIWGDPEVAREMNTLSADEKEVLMTDQEKKYLELQAELLTECREDPVGCEEKSSWEEVTKKISTLNINEKKTGIVRISGRTWGNFPIKITIYEGDIGIQKIQTTSSEIGEYEVSWIPTKKGVYRFEVFFEQDDNRVTIKKDISVEILSTHFDEPFTARIVLQGQMSDNRWLEDDVFYCRSRDSCSVNVAGESNRDEGVLYWWIMPDESVSDDKNPSAMKLEYGSYEILLIATDTITGEVATQSLQIDHKPIPKKAKKPASSKYTLDLKDVPQDKGGGVMYHERNPLSQLIASLIILGILGGTVYLYVRKVS